MVTIKKPCKILLNTVHSLYILRLTRCKVQWTPHRTSQSFAPACLSSPTLIVRVVFQPFTKKLRADWTTELLVSILFRIFYFSLVPKNAKTNIYKTIKSIVLYGYEICLLREKRRLRTFENRVLRRIFRHKLEKVEKVEENCMTRSFMICILHYRHKSFGWWK
jgi:hypothetical protein